MTEIGGIKAEIDSGITARGQGLEVEIAVMLEALVDSTKKNLVDGEKRA